MILGRLGGARLLMAGVKVFLWTANRKRNAKLRFQEGRSKGMALMLMKGDEFIPVQRDSINEVYIALTNLKFVQRQH